MELNDSARDMAMGDKADDEALRLAVRALRLVETVQNRRAELTIRDLYEHMFGKDMGDATI